MVTKIEMDDGAEVILSESKSQKGSVNVTIFAPTPEAVALVVEALFDEYGADEFTQPELCDDGKWGCFGRV